MFEKIKCFFLHHDYQLTMDDYQITMAKSGYVGFRCTRCKRWARWAMK